MLYSLATSAFYYYVAIAPCAGDAQCIGATRLYEVLPWIAVARNAMPTVLGAMRKEKTA